MSRDEQPMQLERHERIRKIPEKLLEERSQLYRVVLREVDRWGVTVNGISKLLQATNVAVSAEDTLDGHVYSGTKLGNPC